MKITPGIEGKTRRWPAIVLTAAITIVVGIGGTWFGIRRSERQAILAESERVRSVRDNLVSIVEEHIVNQTPLEYTTLIRLIEVRSREERLITRISARDLIERSEYNIINSRYLDSKQKEEYKAIFDQLYKQMIPAEYAPFKDAPGADLLNELLKNIRDGHTEESITLLNQYVETLSAEIAALEEASVKRQSWFIRMVKNRTFQIIAIAFFIVSAITGLITDYIERKSARSASEDNEI